MNVHTDSIDESRVVPGISLTHEHLLAVINTEIANAPEKETYSILDAGCGNGAFLTYLFNNLNILWPNKTFLFNGFDVGDHATQEQGFFTNALSKLNKECPGYPWENSIHLIDQNQKWPFADEQFDIIVSNQVLEHVVDRDHFFSEMKRCLKTSGLATHLFPVRECIYDGHIFMPWVHRVDDPETLKKMLFTFSLMGMGSYWRLLKKKNRKFTLDSLIRWSENTSKYMIDSCHYMKVDELESLASRHQLGLDYSYTSKYYRRKLLKMCGQSMPYQFSKQSRLSEKVKMQFLKKISGITVNLRRMS